MKPYKVSVVPRLFPEDFNKRVAYCQWFSNNLNDDATLDNTFFSDESWVHLSGYINSQNYRTWATENPHEFVETDLHPQKLGIIVAMSRRRIIGPIFFEDTINADRYRQLLLQPMLEELNELPAEERERVYFQQDNATPHTAARTLQFLRAEFPGRLISKNLWPPGSPHLTPLDFFLFGYLKTKVFRRRIHTLAELRETIIQHIEAIPREMLINVFDNMKRRVNKCLQERGDHFQYLLQ